MYLSRRSEIYRAAEKMYMYRSAKEHVSDSINAEACTTWEVSFISSTSRADKEASRRGEWELVGVSSECLDKGLERKEALLLKVWCGY